MKIQDISEENLLSLSDMTHKIYEGELYFSASDINSLFLGAFQHLPTVSLDTELKGVKGLIYKAIPFIKYSDIKKHADSLSGLSDFNINIRTALNFNPRKK